VINDYLRWNTNPFHWFVNIMPDSIEQPCGFTQSMLYYISNECSISVGSMSGAVSNHQFVSILSSVWLQPARTVIAWAAAWRKQPVRFRNGTNTDQPAYRTSAASRSSSHPHQRFCTNGNGNTRNATATQPNHRTNTCTEPDSRHSNCSSNGWPSRQRTALARTARTAAGIYTTATLRSASPDNVILVRSSHNASARDRYDSRGIPGAGKIHLFTYQIPGTRSTLPHQWRFRPDIDQRSCSAAHAGRRISAECRSICSCQRYNSAKTVRSASVTFCCTRRPHFV
jgi:hypothetical protein